MLLHIRRIQDERYIAIVSGEHVIVNCPQEKGFAGHSRFFLLTDTCRLVNTGQENIGTANTIITMAPSPAHYTSGSGILLPQCNVTESDTGCCKQIWCRGIFPRRTCLPAEYPLVSQRSVSPCKCCINCFRAFPEVSDGITVIGVRIQQIGITSNEHQKDDQIS